MAQDITSSITLTGITAANSLNERADHETAWNSAITLLNNILNGAQSFDQVNFEPATEVTIATGAVTLTQALHTVDTEGDASSDNLDTITMTEGDIAFLQAANDARTVVLTHNVGNILTSTGESISLDTVNKVVLVLRLGSSIYVVGGSGVTTAITVGVEEAALFI